MTNLLPVSIPPDGDIVNLMPISNRQMKSNNRQISTVSVGLSSVAALVTPERLKSTNVSS